MRKIIFFALFVLSLMSPSLQAIDVEARVAYFLPEDKRMRHIYGKNGFAEYELEASTPLSCCCECACDWDTFLNLAFYQKRGESSCLHDHTRVTNWALNFGVKRYFDVWECFRPYLGLGVGAAHVKFHDESPFVKQHIHEWGFALLAKSGIQYAVTCDIFLDLFVDYSYHWFNFHHVSGVSVRNVNTGGLKAGLGVGYQF